MPTLVDDEEFEDLYRPETPSSARAPRRNSLGATGDFAERSRSRRARAAMLQDGYDDGFAPASDYDDEVDDDLSVPRSRRRVPVTRNGARATRLSMLSTRWGRIGIALAVAAILGVLASIFMLVRGFFSHDPRFRIDTFSSIQILGNSEISRSDLQAVFGSDVSRNVFMVPLAERRAALQQLPWVQSATVMRLLPNQLRVSIVERVPVAFVREGNKIQLVDSTGVILSMPSSMLATRHYSFPVVVGISPSDTAETRAERMQLYEKFINELDSSANLTTGTAQKPVQKSGTSVKVSQQLSEVDVSDPEDVRALMPSAGADILVHFGDEDFANRYRVYQQHLAQWRQQYPHLAAVDLRYDRQTVLEMSKSAEQDPANNDKVDTTPTMAVSPSVKPRAATHTSIKKPVHPAHAAAKPAKPKLHLASHASRG